MQYIKHFVGIDISKNNFFACFNEIDKPKKFNNNSVGILEFIEFLKTNKYLKKNTVIGLESTGRYHLPLSIMCSEHNYVIKVINPIITKRYTQSTIRGVKNDSADSKTIRSCTVRGEGYEFKENTESMILKNLVRERYFLVQIKTIFKVKHQDIVFKERYIKSPITDINYEMEKILSKKIYSLEQKLTTYNVETQKLLQSIPGVGKITAFSMAAEIGDIKRFNTAKQLVGFIGVDPRVYESGISIKGKGYITKRGNKILRKLLFNAAMSAVQKPNMFRDFYVKKVSEGKPKKVALCAVMRKMIHVIFSVWSRETPFVPDLTSS
tara:strand:+ start:1071 stop:2039 length:969 start_codon:yes stop_codon:yes gene_type:complete